MEELYLVINAGSSSLKFSLYEMPDKSEIVSGVIEKIGLSDSLYTLKYNGKKIKGNCFVKNHDEAISLLFKLLIENKFIENIDDIKGVGHRILHGGEKYSDSVLINEEVINDIRDLIPLGPLHLSGELSGIIEMMNKTSANQVAVFDTAFHQTIPEKNYIYPVPYDWYTDYGVRKYGFHGTSHKYITEKVKGLLNKEDVNLIVCHVGSGASIACVKDGKCYDTTMGLTPLDGLMMGTRSGSIDSSILEYISKKTGYSLEQITNKLNNESGFLGVCGVSDCRDVENEAKNGNRKALLALDMYADRIAKYIAQYYLELEGKVDSIVFTAGLLENSSTMRKMVIDRLAPLGISINEKANDKIAGFKDIHEGIITSEQSNINIIVLPTNEEQMILEDTYNICKKNCKDKVLRR